MFTAESLDYGMQDKACMITNELCSERRLFALRYLSIENYYHIKDAVRAVQRLAGAIHYRP